MTSAGTLLIRADASTQIGTGHVMRCLALAQAWQEVGGDVCFVLAYHVPALEARLQTEGMQVVHVEVDAPGSVKDAAATAVLAQQHQAEWVVVDGYHFDAEYQQSLKSAGFRLLFIDDYGHASHYYADIVLNQNIYAQPELYPSRESYTQLLLGTKYALLRREFWEWREWQRPFLEKARKILVTLGGSDPDNVTLTVIQALRQLPYEDLEAIVLVGAQNPYYNELKTAVSQDQRIQLKQNAANMPELMAWADLAVCAGGSTSWELAFMGLPTLMVCLAENQLSIVQYLHEAGLAGFLGWYSDVSVKDIQKAIVGLVELKDKREAMSWKARSMVDGCGAKHVAHLFAHCWLTLRPVQQYESRLVWLWANDPDVRKASFSTTGISWESHNKWFSNKLNDPNCTFYIAYNFELNPVGQVRYDIQHEECVISVGLAHEFRGCGYGTQLIKQSTQRFFTESKVKRIIAYIKEENIASIRAFLKASFEEIESVIINGNRAKKFSLEVERGGEILC